MVYHSDLSSQKEIYVIPTLSYNSMTYYNDSISFIDLNKQSTFLNQTLIYGLDIGFYPKTRYRYYQTSKYGFRIGMRYSSLNQRILYRDYSVNQNFKFLDIPILFSKMNTNNPIFIYEIGFAMTYFNNKLNNYTSIIKIGGLNTINKKLKISNNLSLGITHLPIKSYRFWFGFETNLYFKN